MLGALKRAMTGYRPPSSDICYLQPLYLYNSNLFSGWLFFLMAWPWSCRHYNSSKRWELQHSVPSQTTWIRSNVTTWNNVKTYFY